MANEQVGVAGDLESSPDEVVCLGESMVLFVPAGTDEAHWRQTVGGAESNVACHLAGGGVPSRWVSSLGADPFGQAVLRALRESGVDTADVRLDPDRPTGVYFKAAAPAEVRYYRAGSAAAAMGPELLQKLDFSRVGLLHLTGITPALSAACHDLVEAALSAPRAKTLVSFDVNWRPSVWDQRGANRPKASESLGDLANRADIVFVGDDESRNLWNRSTVSQIRDLLPAPRSLVIKQGARGATLVEDGIELFEPALHVDVVEPVGAGDAFAAGFLAATLRGCARRERLRAGHLQAAAVLCTDDDMAPALAAADFARLLRADEHTWARARIRQGEVFA